MDRAVSKPLECEYVSQVFSFLPGSYAGGGKPPMNEFLSYVELLA